MKKRTALVACAQEYAGAWSSIRGNEVGVYIQGLGEGEAIVVDVMLGTDKRHYVFDNDGSHTLDMRSYHRYRVGKSVSLHSKSVPTTVEILLNGKAHN